ncbi:MAG TPA: serine hydrolase [Pyrinomonadaceae bacterium]|jgi:beta-lactamase class A
MKSIITLALALVTCAAARAQTPPAPTPTPTPVPAPQQPKPVPAWLDRRVRAEVAGFKGNVYLYAKNLDTGAVYDLGGDEPVRTASTIKVAVMVEAFARVAEGKAKWSDELVLGREARYAGSGVLQDLTDGLRLTLRDAVTLMMTVSDNTATNMVLDHLSTDAVNARMESLGFRQTRIMRRVGGGGVSREGQAESNKRFGLGRTTPREMATIMEKLERGEIVSPAVSKEMIDLLKREQGTDGIWRNLWRVPKATKSGALDALRSNVGLIYHPRGRIALAVTCDDMPEPEWTPDNPAYLLMSRLSELIIDGLGK